MEKWNWYVKKYEDEDEYESDFSVHEVSEYENGKLNPLYGMDKYNLTDADIEELKDGKILYGIVNDGEYSIVIGLGSAIDNHFKEDSNE